MGTGKQKTAGQDGMLKHRNGISNSFTGFYKDKPLRMEESFHPLLTLNVNLHEAKA